MTGGIDFALDAGGQIAGKVTDAATTTGLAYAEVDIYTEDGSSSSPTRTRTAPATTRRPRASPRAAIAPDERLVLRFRPVHRRGLRRQALRRHLLLPLAEGAAIGVSLGATTRGIDFALDKGGQIAGKVTDASTTAGVAERRRGHLLGGRPVDVLRLHRRHRQLHHVLAASRRAATTRATYQYRRRASTSTRSTTTCPAPAAVPEISGTPIDVTLGATTSGIDFALDTGGSISGRITSAAGRNRDHRLGVYAYTPTGHVVRSSAPRAANGNYTLGGLPPGRYVVETEQQPGLRGRGLRRSAVRGIAAAT